MPETEPQDLTSTEAKHELLALAVAARAADHRDEAVRLVARLVGEVPPAALAPFLGAIGERWMDSFRDVAPIMTMVIAESGLEEAVEALTAGDLAAALAHLEEVAAYHPRDGSPDTGVLVFYEGLRASLAPEPVEEAPVAPEPVASEPVAPEAELPGPTPGPEQPALPVIDWLERGNETLPRDLATALVCFERAIERTPHIADTWEGRGRALLSLGRPEEALPAFEHVLKLAPYEGRVWGIYAQALALMGRNDAAQAAHRQALALDPDLADAAPGPTPNPADAASAHYRQGRFQEALALLEAQDSAGLRETRLRADCLMGLGRPRDAWPFYKALPDDQPDLWIERGLCLDRLGRPADARSCFERANPSSPRRWLHLARHDEPNARAYFARAVAGFTPQEQAGALDHRANQELAFARARLAALGGAP
ncbi:MAG: hypothetical protein JWM80_4876 [Cyanobacteria bacterium RYN_339]|nr:hypothetical protein [Cyanobacteria bacterium RYN_339]